MIHPDPRFLPDLIPMPPLMQLLPPHCYPGFRGTKEEPKRTQRGGIRVFPGRTMVSSHGFQKTVTIQF